MKAVVAGGCGDKLVASVVQEEIVVHISDVSGGLQKSLVDVSLKVVECVNALWRHAGVRSQHAGLLKEWLNGAQG